MAISNSNYKIVNLPTGTYTASELGDGISASTVHQVFCVTGGSIKVSAIGGGSFTWTATAGQSLDIFLSGCIVNSGEFAGFKAPSNSNGMKRVFY